MNNWMVAAIACAALAGARTGMAQEADRKPASVLEFTVNDIDGKAVPLSKYKGKVLLIVNTASRCGHTPQYAALQKLHEKYQGQGLAILAFPANEFGKQEPGTDQQIKEFCTASYSVEFDLFSKIVARGEGQAPVYQFLTSSETNGEFGGEIRWNFTKFLVSREGKVVARYEPKIKPDDPQVVEAIEKQLRP
jgi:glutathione peroxidase